mmetsp:Transcript_86391/g.239571  ORF Transcript_86391/g.239571 Transcript_86391/m.239571 type:complete len:350 (-) Transcript_86391:65-1114(-)
MDVLDGGRGVGGKVGKGKTREGPPRLTEAQIRREHQTRSKGGKKGRDVPTTVLTLWQPLASFLAYGLQRVEGRGWTTAFRGPLWIHAASKDVSKEETVKWESLYRKCHAADGNEALRLPDHYPTSALVGLVEVVDVIKAEEWRTWKTLPSGVRLEGRCHGSGFLFLIERHRRLPVPLKMSGQHKLWRIDRRTAMEAFQRLVESEQTPIRFASHRDRVLSVQQLQGVAPNEGDEADTDNETGGSDASLLELALLKSMAEVLLPDEELQASQEDDDCDVREAMRLSMLETEIGPKATALSSAASKPSSHLDAGAAAEPEGASNSCTLQPAEAGTSKNGGVERRRGRWRKAT